MACLVEQVNALRARPLGSEDFEAMERELHALFAEAEREVVGETLERLDVDLPYVEMEGVHQSGATPPGASTTGWRAGFTLAKLPANTRNAGNRSRAGGW